MRTHLQRRQLINHQPVQGALLRHTLVTWFTALVSWAIIAAAWDWLWGGTSPAWLRAVVVTATVSVAALPVLAVRLARLTNRFVGPVHRVKLNLRRLARNDAVQPVQFRQGDFLHELADAFNELLHSLRAARRAANADDALGAHDSNGSVQLQAAASDANGRHEAAR